MQPTATITGQLFSLEERSFKNNDGETIDFIQASIVNPDDQYNPTLKFTVDDEILKGQDIQKLSEQLINKRVRLIGSPYMQPVQINDIWTRKLRIRIDKKIELAE